MDFTLFVKILEAFEDFAEDDGDVLFLEITWRWFHEVENASSSEVFHDDPELRPFEI